MAAALLAVAPPSGWSATATAAVPAHAPGADRRTSDRGVLQVADPGSQPAEVPDIGFFAGVLMSDGTADELRRQAVDRLARDGSDDAVRALAEALTSGKVPVVTATLQALGQSPDADRALLAPLLEPMLVALDDAPRSLLDPLGLLLARLEGSDHAPIRELALDPSRLPAQRLAAIHVLGVLATLESGDTLIRLADPAEDHDLQIRRAAREALARMVGRDLGEDHGAWARWWRQVRARGINELWREVRRSDREQIARLQTELDALASQHVALLRQLYAGFNDPTPSPEEISLLRAHLADPVPAVRRFAIERVERLVRDSVAIPDPLVEPILARLDDGSAMIRTAAVRLLDEAAVPGLADRLITRLPAEPDSAAAAAMLDVLGRDADADAAEGDADATATAAGHIVARLEAPSTAAAAARASWMLANANKLPEAARQRAAELAAQRLADDAAPLPEGSRPDVVRLLATVGDDAAADALLERLVPETPPALAAAIAEGLWARGERDRLLQRSTVVAIQPVLVEALGAGDPTADRLHHLLDLEPALDADRRRPWESAVSRLASRLPGAEILAIDAELQAREGPTIVERRRLILVSSAEVAANAGREDAPELLLAACTLLLDRFRPADAWALLERAGTMATNERLRSVRARAAMSTGRYDEAAAVVADPAVWLGVLAEVVARSESDDAADAGGRAAETARRLADEIGKRFAGDLDEQQLAALGRMVASLGPPTPRSGSGAGAPPPDRDASG